MYRKFYYSSFTVSASAGPPFVHPTAQLIRYLFTEKIFLGRLAFLNSMVEEKNENPI